MATPKTGTKAKTKTEEPQEMSLLEQKTRELAEIQAVEIAKREQAFWVDIAAATEKHGMQLMPEKVENPDGTKWMIRAIPTNKK